MPTHPRLSEASGANTAGGVYGAPHRTCTDFLARPVRRAVTYLDGHRAIDACMHVGTQRRTRVLKAIATHGHLGACSRGGDDNGAAQSPSAAPVGVRNRRIEIDGVACLEHMFVGVHVHAEDALDHVNELDARVIVGP